MQEVLVEEDLIGCNLLLDLDQGDIYKDVFKKKCTLIKENLFGKVFLNQLTILNQLNGS